MSQENALEAAKSRIQRLVDEIANLSKRDLRSEEFFAQFLERAVKACDARGGAVWLVANSSGGSKHEFQLAAHVEFESSLFHRDEAQRNALLRVLAQVAEQKRPLALAASKLPEAGSLEAHLREMGQTAGAANPPDGGGNRTAHPFLHVPLLMKDQVIGVLQVWLQPYVTPQNYHEFLTFLASLGAYVEQHLQSRRLGTLVLETQRLQHLLKLAADLAGCLDPQEAARLAANYGRDLVGCERCTVAWIRDEHWEILSVSGQETVEKKSALVKSIQDFIQAHVQPHLVALSKTELLTDPTQTVPENPGTLSLPEPPPMEAATASIDVAYFQISHVLSAVVVPFLDEQGQILGAFFAESTSEAFFVAAAKEGKSGPKEHSAPCRIAEWIATQTARTLRSAEEYHSLPLLGISRRIRSAKSQLSGSRRKKTLLRMWVAGTALGITALYPAMERIDGNCSLFPVQRVSVVPETPGRVEKVLVREGDFIPAGGILAQLDTRRIETELAANEQERYRLQADSERYRSLGDEASAQVTQLQARVAEQNEKKLRADLQAATLRTPIAGVVLSKDLDLRAGEFLQPGTPFAEVAALDRWELVVEVDEKQIGRVERALPQAGGSRPLPVHFLLYSQSAHTLRSELQLRSQISSAAVPRETQNVFLVTLRDVPIPPLLQGSMRPGLTGRAKIDLGRKPLAYLYATRIWNWFQMRMIG
jgi:hypothetical protein